MKLIFLFALIIAALAIANAAARCPKTTPKDRDYTWLNYNRFNGFAYKNTQAKDGIFKTEKVISLKKCFQNCVDNRTSPKNCLSFSYELETKKCRLSNTTIPYDPTNAQEMATAQRWCLKKGFTSGWITSIDD